MSIASRAGTRSGRDVINVCSRSVSWNLAWWRVRRQSFQIHHTHNNSSRRLVVLIRGDGERLHGFAKLGAVAQLVRVRTVVTVFTIDQTTPESALYHRVMLRSATDRILGHEDLEGAATGTA